MQKIRQDMHIGRNLRALRKAAHMTQEDVVAHLQLKGCDISRSVYSQMESGSYSIRVSELVAFTELFGVDFNRLFANLDQ